VNGRIEEHIELRDRTDDSSKNGFTDEAPSDRNTIRAPGEIRGQCRVDSDFQGIQTENRDDDRVRTRTQPHKQKQMVFVAAGSFKTGLSANQVNRLLEQLETLPIDKNSLRKLLEGEPLKEINLPAFYIDRYLVTNEQFESFVKDTGYRTTAENEKDQDNWRNLFSRDKENHPIVCIVCVSFRDAEEYAKWAGKRLPTDQEWEKAFRGTEAQLYPWGDVYNPELCNTADNCRGFTTTEVDRFTNGKSPYGCYDMVGNVEEFTTTPDNRGNRWIFGGSWEMTCQVYGLPILKRLASDTFYSKDLGFRCAKNA